ncbi:hypothetical protein AB1N83_014280 [Pleurotus pulmonarius]
MPSRTKTPPGYILQAKFPPLLYTYWPDDTSTAFFKMLIGRVRIPQVSPSMLLDSAQAQIQIQGRILCAPSTTPLKIHDRFAAPSTYAYAYGVSCKFLHTLKSVDESPVSTVLAEQPFKSDLISKPRAASHTATARSKEPKEPKKSKKSKKSKKPKESEPEPRESYFSAFFARYPEFRYNPANSAILEFDRLCKLRRDEAHQAFKDAMVKEFNDIYGTDEGDINSWHKICTVLDIDPLPKTLRESRDIVMSKHINLVDLVDSPTGHVVSFASLEALAAYTISTRKVFPKGSAYAGGLLKYLLREILGEYEGRRRPSNFGGRRRRR